MTSTEFLPPAMRQPGFNSLSEDYSTRQFGWDARRRTFTARASVLGLVYCPRHLYLTSHVTGKCVAFSFERVLRDRDGAVLLATWRSDETGLRIEIINDQE